MAKFVQEHFLSGHRAHFWAPPDLCLPRCVFRDWPMYLVKPLSRDKGKRLDTQCICPFCPTDSLGRKGQIHCVSARHLVPREGLYQIHGHSLNTHRGKTEVWGCPTFAFGSRKSRALSLDVPIRGAQFAADRTAPIRSDSNQKRPDVHKIVLSIKLRFPPPPRKSVNSENFLRIY